MGECETSEATSNSSIGIILVLLACVCYACGNCLQRYSLLRAKGEKVFYVLNRHAGWLLGAIVYFSANGIYSIALSYAPVSVLAAVFSLTIVANATCAVLVLGDTIPKLAYAGYAAVLAGSVVFSVSVKAEVCHFGAAELVQVMTSASAMIYWVLLGFVMFGGMAFAYRYEKVFPLPIQEASHDEEEEDVGAAYAKQTEEAEQPPADEHVPIVLEPSPITLLMAGCIYPASLGATEAVGALVLKAVNSLFTTIATEDGDAATDEEEGNFIGLWVGLFGVGIFIFIGIVTWLRLVYSRFEITAAFPVEFGMLTFASVVGGFAVFEDHQYVDSALGWVWVSLACLLILGGIGIVAIASWKKSTAEPEKGTESDEQE